MGRGDEMLAFQRLDTLSRGPGCLFSGCADSGSQPEESTATPILPILNPSPVLCEIGNQREGSIFFAMCFFIMCVRPCARGAHNLNRQNPSFCRFFSTRVCFPPSKGHGRHPQQHQDNDNNNANTTLNKG